MAFYETEAIILRTYNLADADKIAVFLSKEEGLIRGVAKGAKRLKSKFGGGLEPFSIVDLTYILKEERDLALIQQIELKSSFFESASDPDFLKTYAYLVDLINDFAPPHEPNEKLYRMVKACLEQGSEDSEGFEAISCYFEYWILSLSGYIPDWSKCGKCARKLAAHEKTYLDLDFNLVCGNCDGSRMEEVTPEFRQLFEHLKKLSPGKFSEEYSGRLEAILSVSSILRRIISRVLDKKVRVRPVELKHEAV